MSGVRCTDKKETAAPAGYTPREWARVQEKEALEKRKQRKLFGILLLLTAAAAMMIFLVYYFVIRSHDYDLFLPYDKTDTVLSAGATLTDSGAAEGFAADLCVASGDTNSAALTLDAYSAGLFDLNNMETMYGKDLFTERSPASITKVVTALVTLKYGNLDDIVTVTDTALNIETGSSVCDVKVGDVLSLRQLLYGMMVASGNDAAMMIAEHVGGSVDNFVALMNQEAASLGATHSHFMNPHGLTQENHYTCVYDLYLFYHAAMEYDTFMDIISRKNYYAEYTRADGTAVAVTWESTNHYFTNESDSPDGIVIYGGKTGTTDDAGACLSLIAKDKYGNPYLAVILHSESKDTLYPEMNELLSLIDV